MTLDEFKTSIYSIEKVQFEDGIDCFYDNSKIDQFIIACYNKLNKN